jgi:hypothetical protein
VIRAIGGQCVEVIHDREDARTQRNLVGFEPLGIALAVPAFVVAEDQGCHRIGERHRTDDLRADLRVDANLLKLFLRQGTRLGEDVLRHGKLPDVVQERRGFHPLNFAVRHAERFRQARRIDLDTADVRLRCLVLGIDRERERFDGRKVQVGHLLHVPPFVVDASEVDLVGAVGQIERSGEEQGDPDARPEERPLGSNRDSGSDEVARRTPQEVLIPHVEDRLMRREADGDRDEQRVADEVGRGGADERPRDFGDVMAQGSWHATQPQKCGA